MSIGATGANTDDEAVPSLYSDLDETSPTDSLIAGYFRTLSATQQKQQRDEWKRELRKTEVAIMMLKEVVASKEAHACGLKQKLGMPLQFPEEIFRREFSEDMAQGIKKLQESNAYKKTAEGLTAAKITTASMWHSTTASVSADGVLGLGGLGGWSSSFVDVTEKVVPVFDAAKTKMANSFSHHGITEDAINK